MKSRIFALAIAFAATVTLWAADDSGLPEKYTMAYGDTVRTYRMYLPESVKEGAPLVVYPHGYGDAPSGCDVVIYEIAGGEHSWADQDVDTSKLLWDFFSRYLTTEN